MLVAAAVLNIIKREQYADSSSENSNNKQSKNLLTSVGGLFAGKIGKLMRGSSRRRGSQSTYQARSVTIDENGEEIIRLKKVIQVKTGASLKLREEMNEKAKELRPHMHDGHLKPAPAVPQS